MYSPGETLDPDCAPGSSDCGVLAFSINNQSGNSQTLVAGTSGLDFNILSSSGVHTFNIPDASASARGLLTNSDWNIFNSKQGALGYAPANPANNLSDIENTETARINLGLGTLSTQSGTFSGISSGINTGDQTAISGNAGTATALQTARMINGVAFNGTSDVTVPAASGTLTGTALAPGITSSSLTRLGTLTSLSLSGSVVGATSYNGLTIAANTGVVTSGVWNGTAIAVANGGTGTANGSISGTGALSFISNKAEALTLDSGTTGEVNVGTGNDAKTINIGTGRAGNAINIGSDNTAADNLTIGSARDTATIGAGIFNIANPGSQLNGSKTLCINANRVRAGASSSSCNTSSMRIKHNINDLDFGIDAVDKLRPVNFYYNDTDTFHNGLIAEEVYNILPTAVALDSDNLPYAIDYDEITPVIIKAIKETSALMGNISPGGIADGEGGGFISGIQSEPVRNPIAAIAGKAAGGQRFLADFIAARVTAIRGYFDKLFAKEIHTEQICVRKSGGDEICISGDRLDSLLQNTSNAYAIIPSPGDNVVLNDASADAAKAAVPDANMPISAAADEPVPDHAEAIIVSLPVPSAAEQSLPGPDKNDAVAQ